MGNILSNTQSDSRYVSQTAFYGPDGTPLFIEKAVLEGKTLYTYTEDIVNNIITNNLNDPQGNPIYATNADFIAVKDLSDDLKVKLENTLSYQYKFQKVNVGNDWSILTNQNLLCINKGQQQVVCIDGTGKVDYDSINTQAPSFQPNTAYNGFM